MRSRPKITQISMHMMFSNSLKILSQKTQHNDELIKRRTTTMTIKTRDSKRLETQITIYL